MQVQVIASVGHAWPDGLVEAWQPGQEVVVDDRDAERVAYFRELARVGLAKVVEEPEAQAAPARGGRRGAE